MRVDEFNYHLPEELIAQTPLENRCDSRLMVVDRNKKTIEHFHFYDIIDFLNKGDVLVLNDTKVIPSRIYGRKTDTLANIEILLLKDLGNDVWECLAKPQKRLKIGTILEFNESLSCEVVGKFDEGICHVKFIYEGIFLEKLETVGQMPLPPYIHEKLDDKDRYQTVYANELGSSAAPTAGLHFTKELLEKIEEKGIEVLYVTLHVGLGTFRPVMVDDIKDHHMHHETYKMTDEVACKLNKAKSENRRIISVGTTSTRTLESIYTKYNKFVGCSESTNIFIYPGYEFKAIDGLITNFHLPKSTLVMLVSALATKELIMESYSIAVKEKYRFFSFGDAMFIK